MKNNVLLILLFLSGCQKLSDNDDHKAIPLEANIFTFSAQCPYLCWLGINPGSSTLDEVKDLLSVSSQIDQESIKIYGDSSISLVWYDKELGKNLSRVEIEFREGVVSSIFFNRLPFSVNHFVTLLGEPSQISITAQMGTEADYFDYALYFSMQKVLLYSSPSANQNGPQPDDVVSRLVLNTLIYKYTLPITWSPFQPWLGYGHAKEYLKDQELPPGFIMPEK